MIYFFTYLLAPGTPSAPTVTVLDSYTIRLSWEAPQSINEPIEKFELYRNGTLAYTGQSLSFVDGNLLAAQIYSYFIIAYNDFSNSSSSSASGRTPENVPIGISAPILEVLSSSSIEANWTLPAVSNGAILNYTLLLNSFPIYSGLGFSFTCIQLLPYRSYTFQLSVCNLKGCSLSDIATAVTFEAAPQGILWPSVSFNSPSSANINWTAPFMPNGVITGYEVWVNGSINAALLLQELGLFKFLLTQCH